MSSICIVGAMPPPVHGMSVVNAAVRAHLERRGTSLTVIDISPRSLSRSAFARAGRLRPVFRGIFKYLILLLRGQADTLYLGLSGGSGQLYDLAFALFARVFGRRLFLHHHSFAYLTSKSILTACLLHAAGKRATNIVLCSRMENLLRHLYHPQGRVLLVSNAAMLDVVPPPLGSPRSLATVGFLGNVSEEKGIYEFLDVISLATRDGLPIKGCIAGPFQDAAVERTVLARCAEDPSVRYAGPVYGHSKSAFFQGIDALLFPTQYKNEAEPLTILEALAHGVPVIARSRGCISSMLARSSSLCVEDSEEFIDSAIRRLHAWMHDDFAFNEARAEAQRHFALQRAHHMPSLDRLCSDMARAAEV